MKKSFWGVMLTLAALVMMLGASSAFAYNSKDVTVDLTSSDVVSISGDVSTLTFKDAYGVQVSGDKNDDTTNQISTDIVSAAVTSTSVMKPQTVVVYVGADKTGKLGLANAKVGGTASKVAPVIYDVVISTDNNITGIKTTAHEGSIDVKATSKDSYAVIFYSGDQASNDTYIVVLTVSGDVATSEADTGNAFTSAYFSLSADTSLGTITPATFTLKPSATSQSVTLGSGLAAATISFDISSDVKLDSATSSVSSVTATVVDKTSPDQTKVTVKAPAAGASADVTFKFLSGDAGDSFDVIVTLNVSSGSSEKTIDDIADVETAAAVTEALTELGWTTDQQTAYATELVSVLGENAKITGITSTDNGIAILNITDGTNEYAGIPAVNGKIVVAVDSAGNVTGLPSYVTPAKLAAEFATLTGQSTITSIPTFYSSVFPTTFFTTNTPAADPDELVEGDNGGITSFEGTLGNSLPYGTIILVYLLPTDEDTTASAIQGVMVHTGALKERSEKIAFALADVQDISGSAMSDITIPVTEPYNIGYSTPDGGNTFSGESVEDGSFGVAATTTGDSGSLASELTLDGDTAAEVEGSNKGSSSGCDAGFGALALLALALPLVKKFSK